VKEDRELLGMCFSLFLSSQVNWNSKRRWERRRRRRRR